VNILIVKIGAIGDVVMALPVVPEIRNKHPKARITWLCGQQVEPLLKNISGIDRLISIEEKGLFSQGFSGKLKTIGSVWRKLAGETFDLVLYYYHSPLYKVLFFPARIREMRGFGALGQGNQLPVPGRHHSLEYIQAFSGQEGPYAFRPAYPEYRHPPGPAYLSPSPGKKIVALSCGGAKNILRDDDLRRWPIDHYRKLAELLLAQGIEVVLTGSAGDKWILPHFEGLPVQDWTGKLPLVEFVRFLKECDLLVTHDSGPLHLADLAPCPVLGLFGPTVPHEKISLQPGSAYLWGGKDLACRPCYEEYGRCSANRCLGEVSPEAVFQKALAMLESAPVG
jgi:heptosyltransferase II